MSLALILAASTFTAGPEDAPARLDPVVTTATASQTPLSDIPMSVSVINGEDLGLASAYLGAEDVTGLV